MGGDKFSGDFCSVGPEIDLPFTVGVRFGVSDDEDDGDVSTMGDTRALAGSFELLDATSFRVIDLAPPRVLLKWN